MPRPNDRFYFYVLIGSCLLAMGASPVLGRIRCEGAYQIVSGSKIATPYCEDAYLSAVARTYGAHVSAQSIRQNSHTKSALRRLIGDHIRVFDIWKGNKLACSSRIRQTTGHSPSVARA
jgi:hypothetical protein